jgi:hypothetical protein
LRVHLATRLAGIIRPNECVRERSLHGGKRPKLKPAQEAHLVELWRAGRHTSAEFAELFSAARSTVYRAVARAANRHQRRPSAP